MKRMRAFGKLVSIALIAVMVLTVIPAQAFATEGEDEGFYLLAMTGSQTIIEPTLIKAEPDQNIRDALSYSGYDIVGLDIDFISAVEGVIGEFRIFYDEGGYDLSAPASSITVFCITTQDESYTPDLLDLIYLMGEYNERTDGVKNYPAAKSAYDTALANIRTSGAGAKALADDLRSAVQEYESLLSGDTKTVTFNITQGGATLSSAEITMTGAYENVVTASGTSISVIPGKYSFVVSDGGFNRTEGNVTVGEAGASVDVELPSGTWIDSVDIGKASGVAQYYEKEITGSNAATYYLPDTTKTTGQTMLYAVRGTDGPEGSSLGLRTLYTGTNGTDYSTTTRIWASNTTNMSYLVEPGVGGREFEVIARYVNDDSHVMIQAYNVNVVRSATLSALEVSGDGTVLPLVFDSAVYEYSLTTVSDEVKITAQAFAGYESGYSINVNGKEVADGESATVELDEDIQNSGGTYSITVKVNHGSAFSGEYSLKVTKVDAVDVRVTNPGDDTDIFLTNEAGSEIVPVEDDRYRLIPSESYTYVATRDTWYHTTKTFIASADLIINAAAPINSPWLSEIATASSTSAASKTSAAYSSDKEFSPTEHEYTYTAPDTNTIFAVWATATTDAGAVTIKGSYNANNASETAYNINVTSGNSAGVVFTSFLGTGGAGNTSTLEVARAADGDGVVYYQEYILHSARTLSLTSMTASIDGTNVILKRNGTDLTSFNSSVFEYTVEVPVVAESLALSLRFPSTTSGEKIYGGYQAVIETETNSYTVDYAHSTNVIAEVFLAPSAEQEDITITITHPDERSVSQVYTITVVKLDPVYVDISYSPTNATVFVIEDATGKRMVPNSSGLYEMLPNYSYTYTVSLAGYVAQSETIVADEDKTISVSLQQAAGNDEIISEMASQWPSFRGNSSNNAVTAAKTPIVDEDTVLYWANKVGDGYSGGAAGSPIIVDGYLYTYAVNTILKINTLTGEEEAHGTMARNSAFSITPPTYAEGMIFVALGNGYVQAFNADTLESLWVYQDSLSGQPNSPITYHDGYIYTGFWNSEVAKANYVCLSITDENPNSTNESKKATWTFSHAGGFYWAGAYVCDDFLLVGADDGYNSYLDEPGKIYSLHPKTGLLIDSLTMPYVGDVRSSICYDTVTDAYYFTSKGGHFYQVKMDEDGTIIENSLRIIALDNGGNNPSTPAMSTSTPVVYNGRAYIGVSGTGQFSSYSGHNITVIDLSSWSIAYSVPTQGYPQTSGLLTTAYDEGDGTVYVYFLDNMTPGKLRVISDKAGQTQPTNLVTESYTSDGNTYTKETAYTLFTPSGAQSQYAICSPIVDEYGTLYFKNDSGHMMAVGNSIESLEITTPPSKTSYDNGDVFDPEGMTVTAIYSNSMTRDVTEYISFEEGELSADMVEFEIRFDHVMYQNKEGEAGVLYDPPTAILALNIGETLMGDTNGDGFIDAFDALYVMRYTAGNADLSPQQMLAADLNGDGFVDAFDSLLIMRKAAGSS